MKNNSIYQKIFSSALFCVCGIFIILLNQTTVNAAARTWDGGSRITNAQNRGIGNVRVTLVDTQGNARVAVTNPFGYYRFTQIQAGQSVVISVRSKNFIFNNPTRAVFAANDLDEINFAEQ